MFPKSKGRSLHLLLFPVSRPVGVRAFVEQKIIQKIMEVTRRLFGQKDKITLDAHQDSHAHATGNSGSIKEESKVINMVFIQIPLITPHQSLIDFIQKITLKTSSLN